MLYIDIFGRANMCYNAKSSITSYIYVGLITTILCLYGNKYDRHVALFFFVVIQIQLAEFSTNLKSILKADVPKFHIDGDYLKKYGMQEGASLGKALKIVENEWIENNFAISQNRVKEIR